MKMSNCILNSSKNYNNFISKIKIATRGESQLLQGKRTANTENVMIVAKLSKILSNYNPNISVFSIKISKVSILQLLKNSLLLKFYKPQNEYKTCYSTGN